MAGKKLKLKELEVESFVTNIDHAKDKVGGGTPLSISLSVSLNSAVTIISTESGCCPDTTVSTGMCSPDAPVTWGCGTHACGTENTCNTDGCTGSILV